MIKISPTPTPTPMQKSSHCFMRIKPNYGVWRGGSVCQILFTSCRSKGAYEHGNGSYVSQFLCPASALLNQETKTWWDTFSTNFLEDKLCLGSETLFDSLLHIHTHRPRLTTHTRTHTHTHTYTYTHVHSHRHTHTGTLVHRYTHTHMHIFTHPPTFTHTHLSMGTDRHTHRQMHAHMHKSPPPTHTYAHPRTPTQTPHIHTSHTYAPSHTQFHI